LSAIALMGPTGAGKSALAMKLALAKGMSIIACDSMQVYRGLDIGTAKPDVAERKAVPHFLIDWIVLPDVCSAARWAAEAAAVIRRENAAGRTPLVVGGTGLYLRALREGFAEIPPVDAGVYERLEAELAAGGIQAMHRRLAACDAEAAARLNPNDTQRIMRALAVFEASGRPLSEWQLNAGTGAHVKRALAPVACPVFVLAMERDALRARIAARFHAMCEQGWLEEVRWLDGLNLPSTHPAVRAVGYRQLLRHVRGECGYEQAVAEGVTATRRYAKRQLTWFRHQVPDAEWGDADTLYERICAW